MARIIAVANHKGGVGKTTTVLNLGAALAERGRAVLLVDLDPQEALTTSLGVPTPPDDKSLADVLLRRVPLAEILVATNSLNLAPAGANLAETEALLYGEMDRERALRAALAGVARRFDFVLIDCPPSLAILTLNALFAANEVLIPVQTEFLALRRLAATLRTVQRVRERINSRLTVLGILPTLHDARTVLARDVHAQLVTALSKDYRIFPPIPRTVRFAEAPIAGRPIFETAGDVEGARAYRKLAEEIEKR